MAVLVGAGAVDDHELLVRLGVGMRQLNVGRQQTVHGLVAEEPRSAVEGRAAAGGREDTRRVGARLSVRQPGREEGDLEGEEEEGLEEGRETHGAHETPSTAHANASAVGNEGGNSRNLRGR